MARRVHSYESQPYLRELPVEVVKVGEESGRRYVILDDTILYPEGGGQPADGGWLDEQPVEELLWEGEALLHFVAEPPAESEATLRLDWGRRFDHMQQHTAQHLITALAGRHLAWETRSFHIGPQVCDIELAVKSPSREDLDRLEDLVAEEIRRARPVGTRRIDREEYEALEVRSRLLPADLEGDIRLVEIEGLDLNTCGGTHVASTAEIEAVKLLDAEPLRGGCRLYWVAGSRVRRRLGAHEQRSAELRKILDCGEAEFAAVCGLRRKQLEAAQRHARGLEDLWIESLIQTWLGGEERIIETHFEEQEAGFLHRLARTWLAVGGEGLAFLTCADDRGHFFLLAASASSGLPLPELGAQVAEILGGRGGGKGEIYQGRAGSLEKREEVLSMLREEQSELP